MAFVHRSMLEKKQPKHTATRRNKSLISFQPTVGILHTIFFHRLFTPVSPTTHDVLDTTLPYVTEDDIERTIDARATALLRALDTTASAPLSPQYGYHASKPAHGTVVVQFLEKKRKKSGWFIAKADEESVWEVWILNVTVTGARSEPEAARNRRRMEVGLQDTAMRVLEVVNADRGYIPPITTNEANPFPFQVLVNPRGDGWGQRIGIF